VIERNVGPVYAFGPFQFEPGRRILRRDHNESRLPDRISQLLLLLVQANGKVVDRETIAARVWPEGRPRENNLSQHLYMLRELLEEVESDRAYIVTVRRKGYQLAVPIRIIVADAGAGASNAQCYLGAGDALLRSGLDAFHHYGLGCHLLEQQTAESLTEASHHFEEALQVDPDYIPALVGLARTYTSLAENCYVSIPHAYSRAKQATKRVLELDSSCASAHAMLSNISLFCDWNWIRAKLELDAALKFNPTSSFVHSTAAWYHSCLGDNDRAVQEVEHAISFEPSSPAFHLLLARIFLLSGAYEQAIKSLSTLIEAGPAFQVARRYRAQAYILSGEPHKAIGDLLHLPQGRTEDIAFRLPLLARAHADCGEAERANEMYDGLLSMAHTELVPAWYLAIIAVGLNRLDSALEHLEQAMARREPALLTLRNVPWFEALEPRGRFRDILEALGLDSPSIAPIAAPKSERAFVPLRAVAPSRAAASASMDQLTTRTWYRRL
jgi:DNA-binding winged helix-turn-helix (wHTH) protein